MKKALVGLMVALMAVSSFGGLYVYWDNGGVLSGANPSQYILQDSSTTQVIWDLVYTTSDSLTTPTLNESTGAIDYGSDAVISERDINPAGQATVTDVIASTTPSKTGIEFDEYLFGTPSELLYKNDNPGYTSGNLYAAIFQYTSSGDVYAAFTSIVPEQWTWAPGSLATPTAVHFNLDDDTSLSYFGHVTQIPEPATMSLLGLGALAMMIRRKLRK